MTNELGRRVTRPTTQSSETGKPLSRPNLEETFPSLTAFLRERRDLGEYYQTGTATFYIDGPSVKICLNDRPRRLSAFTGGESLWEALCRADRGLLEGSLNWTGANYRRRRSKKVDK